MVPNYIYWIIGLLALCILMLVRLGKKWEKEEEEERIRREHVAAREQAKREAQELSAQKEHEARERERAELHRRAELANSIFHMRVTPVGDLITICRCRGFFMKVQVDPERRDVICEWRFDLWKGAIHAVDAAYCDVRKIKRERYSFQGHDETFSRISARLSTSAFRKDRRAVRGLRGDRTYTFRFVVTANRAQRSFYIDAFVPANAAEYVEQGAMERIQPENQKQQSRLSQFKEITDVLHAETREYIDEVKLNPDLTDEEKDDATAMWEMIRGHQQRVYLRRTLGIDITGDA